MISHKVQKCEVQDKDQQHKERKLDDGNKIEDQVKLEDVGHREMGQLNGSQSIQVCGAGTPTMWNRPRRGESG